ncbi:8-oxo-dGTP pyrophosphatase MutT (NUDIX family) [Crossiella equi]|uniref:8-oxo-dGTP pyrophosphatase MutT (NUDIX family) n=1 Tax=Crossiella equi TaxID=130796 RepID=A0ABS5A930_9PSEU|nr:NUDIX hydrolase [Crossiella equi]MBP2472225.1 8-oxo-dGTP pyrophosphatase MutT (NUDIX family) [Crossiella equi]
MIGVGVVVERDGRLLLGHRVKAGESPTWSLAGGKVDPGESFEQAAVRELREETGLVAQEAEVFALGLTPLPGRSPVWTVGAVVRDVVGDPEVLATHEFASLAWFRPDELPEPLFGPSRFVLDLHRGGPSTAAITTYGLHLPAQH